MTLSDQDIPTVNSLAGILTEKMSAPKHAATKARELGHNDGVAVLQILQNHSNLTLPPGCW